MGRDVAGLRIDKKLNVINVKSNGVSHDTVHVSPKISGESIEIKEYEVEDRTVEDSHVEKCHEKQDVLGVKSTNYEAGLPEGLKPESRKSSEKKINSPVKPASGSAFFGNLRANTNVLHPPGLNSVKPCPNTSSVEAETIAVGLNCSSNKNDSHCPKSAKKSQLNSTLMSRKPQHAGIKKYQDEEDNWSLASS